MVEVKHEPKQEMYMFTFNNSENPKETFRSREKTMMIQIQSKQKDDQEEDKMMFSEKSKSLTRNQRSLKQEKQDLPNVDSAN